MEFIEKRDAGFLASAAQPFSVFVKQIVSSDTLDYAKGIGCQVCAVSRIGNCVEVYGNVPGRHKSHNRLPRGLFNQVYEHLGHFAACNAVCIVSLKVSGDKPCFYRAADFSLRPY